jgi:hypothetical protein
MAQRVMGQHSKDCLPQEQDEFDQLFADVFTQACVTAVEPYSGENVAFVGEEVTGAFAQVRSLGHHNPRVQDCDRVSVARTRLAVGRLRHRVGRRKSHVDISESVHVEHLVGATGVGESFLACALAHQACRKGYRAGYRRASRLFHELTLARADGTYIRLLGKLARLDVLVIDDWGLAPVQDPERRDLLEILEDRYGARSTIITSQLPPAQWHDYLADATLADAICDRLLHNAHRLVLKGPSRRKEAKLDD